MKKVFFYVGIIAVVVTSCESDEITQKPTERKDIILTRTEQEMTVKGNDFAFNFFRQINVTEKKDNFFISPLSASIALSMTSNGADGETLDEMKSTLGFSSYSIDEMNEYYRKLVDGLLNADNTTELGIANSIWIKEGFPVEKPFIDVNKEMYDAEVRNLDFASPQAVSTINQWCSDKTNKRIPEIIEKISDDARLFLINALYFKGIWKNEFDKKNTTKEDFLSITGSKSKVDMMHQECGVPYTAEDGLQIAELPYGNEAFSMVVILPDTGNEIQNVIDKLNPESWDEWMSRLQERNVDIKLPRFKLEYEKDLKDDLQEMDMRLPFIGGEANFSKMSPTELYIGLVKQNTFIEVNEKGTEAAAVTIVGMEITSAGPEPQSINFHVNRPFIYVIKEKSTGAILFMGKMGNL